MYKEKELVGNRGWLITTNAILVAVVMVWIQGWWQTHYFYSVNGKTTITAELSILVLSLIAITSLVNIYRLYKSDNCNIAMGNLFFTLFLVILAIAVNMFFVLLKGFMGTPSEPYTFGLILEQWRSIIFPILFVLSVMYLYIVLRKPNWISRCGNWIVRRVGTTETSPVKDNNKPVLDEKLYYNQIGIFIPIIAGVLGAAVILVPLSIFLGMKPIIGLIIGIVGQILIVLIVATILTHYEEKNPRKILNKLKGKITDIARNIGCLKWLGKAKAVTLMVLTIGLCFTIYSLVVQYIQMLNNNP